MDNVRQTLRVHSGFWFSYFCQGYYFSAGYFAFTNKTAYGGSSTKSLDMAMAS